jgi:hypothetical protein
MFLGRVAPRETQPGADLLSDVICYLTLLNEVGESVRGHILKDLIFLDGDSVQLPEMKYSVTARCEGCSGAAAFWYLCIV